MKKIMVIISMISGSAKAQEIYKIRSIPILDSIGNMYRYSQIYDHFPTAEDSAIFIKENKISISKMTDSIEQLGNQQLKEPQTRLKSKRKNIVNKKHL